MRAAARSHATARIAAWACALAPLLLLWPALRHAIESRMALHMLLEFPLLMAAGFAAAWLMRGTGVGQFAGRAWLGIDAQGFNGALVASAVLLVWMLPSALDAALIEPAINAAKAASWWLAGALLAASLPRHGDMLLLFFAGNAIWMMATAGLLYVDAPQALCVNYLPADQHLAGLGLLALAGLLTLLAGARLVRASASEPAIDGAPAAALERPCAPSSTSHATAAIASALNL